MRIAVDARPLRHLYSGIGRYTDRLTRELDALGHEIIYCESSGGPLTSNIAAHIRFGRQAKAAGADVFWSPRHHLPENLFGIPSVVTIHDLVWRRAPSTMPTLKRLHESIFMSRSLKAADQIIAVSESTRLDLLAFYPSFSDRISVVHEAPTVTPSDARGSVPVAEPYALFVGTLEPRKNLERTITAFLSSQTPFHLVVVGRKGWGKIEVPLNDRIIWRQPEEDHELADLYLNAEFLLAPSLYEGFGLQVVEALAFGKPIIASSVSSLPEVAGPAALYVDPTNTDEIAAAITRLSMDRSLYLQLAEAAKVQSRKFSWEKAAKQTLAVLERAHFKKIG